MNTQDRINSEDLKSTVRMVSPIVTQIIHFVGGEKRTFYNIDTTKVQQGEFTKLFQTDGTLIMINPKNVLCVEVFPQ
jgi:hypothetical protein